MIIVKLSGGLANQMFQYALGRALSIKNNDELKLDVSGFAQTPAGDTKREYELKFFNIEEKFASEKEIRPLIIRNKFLVKVIRRLPFLSFINKRHVIEHGINFQPEILKLKGDLYLEGFWQRKNYISSIEKIIRQDFTLKPEFASRLKQDWLNKINNSNSISVHVRRGDYVTNKITNKLFGVCDLDYYYQGIKLIAAKLKNPAFFVFSDDLDWCQKNIKSSFPIHFVTGNKSYEDLILISNCKHNILANSSFSWWSAWLNSNPDKIVIAPKQWFKKKILSASDLIPESWLTI